MTRRTPDFADIMRHIAYIVLAAQRWRDAKGTGDEFWAESVLLEALSVYERDDRLRRESLSDDSQGDGA